MKTNDRKSHKSESIVTNWMWFRANSHTHTCRPINAAIWCGVCEFQNELSPIPRAILWNIHMISSFLSGIPCVTSKQAESLKRWAVWSMRPKMKNATGVQCSGVSNMSTTQISQNDNKRQNRFKCIYIRFILSQEHHVEALTIFFHCILSCCWRSALMHTFVFPSQTKICFSSSWCLLIRMKKEPNRCSVFSMCVAYSLFAFPGGHWFSRAFFCCSGRTTMTTTHMFRNLIPLNAEVTFFSSPFKNKQMTHHTDRI